MNRAPRTAFTLVEMLVVISIIGVLASLLLPAVQAARESARRAVCIGNQQSLAKACSNYEGKTTEGRLPGYHNLLSASASGLGANGLPPPRQIASWPITLFPYLDQVNIYDQWRVGFSPRPTPHVTFLICPSDINKTTDKASLSYVINGGMAGLQSEKPANGVAHNYYDGVTYPPNGPVTTNGDFYDGRQNTLLFSENVQATVWSRIHDPNDPNGLVKLFQNPLNNNYKETTVFLWHYTDTPNADQMINGNKKTAVLSADTARPSSYHPGGVVVAFADSHVRFLNQNIDYHVYQQLMTPDSKRSNLVGLAAYNYLLQPADYE